MMSRHLPALSLALLAAAALSGASASAGRSLSQAPPCTEVKYDVHYVLEVTSYVCSVYQPGNVSARNVRTSWYGNQLDAENLGMECILVNNSLPGPTVRAKVGDMVRVDVMNNLNLAEVSFHWHGLLVTNYSWADGTAGINSCPITPGRSTTYIFKAERAGTYFYHGHRGAEEAMGVSGPIIIDDPKDPYTDLYDEEWPGETILLRDWIRVPMGMLTSAHQFFFNDKLGNSFGVPTINGYYGNGSGALPFPVLDAAVNTCYRVRLLVTSTNTWPGWLINITDASGGALNMTLLSLTAENLQPTNTHSLAVFMAQRAEFVLCTPSTAQDLNVSLRQTSEGPGPCQLNVPLGRHEDSNPYATGAGCIDHMYAIIRVGGVSTTAPKTADRAKLAKLPYSAVIDTLQNPNSITALSDEAPPRATTTWNLKTGFTLVPATYENQYPNGHNFFLWTERGYAFSPPNAPYLFTKGRCGTSRYTPGPESAAKVGVDYNLVMPASKNQVVDVVITNLSPYMHPIHLHGHRFAVIASKFIVPAGVAPNTIPPYVCPNNVMWADPNEHRPWQAVVGSFVASNFTKDFPFFYGCPYNASDPTNAKYMLNKPYYTDIAPLPAHSWMILRVKFDNPGYWYFHCHNLGHMAYGMGFVVNAFAKEAPPVPSWVDTSCGGVCRADKTQFCGPFSPHNCVTPDKRNQGANICPPPGFIPN